MRRFSKNEIDYLIKNYSDTSKEDILIELKRSWGSIQKKAHQLKLKRCVYESKNNNKFQKLLFDTPETCYWLGMLLSDGHFNKNKYITINLSNKDIDHINKLRDYLGLPHSTKTLVTISDKITYNKLLERFKITSNKTKSPCDISYFFDKSDLFFSFAVGFIDGDGSINKKGNIRIKCHYSWINNINHMLGILTDYKHKSPKINSENLAYGDITSIEHSKKILKRAIDLKLPILNRKWDNIPQNKLTNVIKSSNQNQFYQ